MSTVTQNEVFKSKYGYHPCDRETFLKLKKLHKWFWQTVREYANWYRWNRKQPENRFRWKPRQSQMEKRVRSDIPIPEPKYSQYFVTHPGAKLWNDAVWDHGVLEAYRNARMPVSDPKNVKHIKPFYLKDETFAEAVNRIYEEARQEFEP